MIETVGSEHVRPLLPQQVRALLLPLAPRLGILTLQAAGTASRSNRPTGVFAQEVVASYLRALPQSFKGTLQIQGGITTQTIGRAVQMGAEFLVCGTHSFAILRASLQESLWTGCFWKPPGCSLDEEIRESQRRSRYRLPGND